MSFPKENEHMYGSNPLYPHDGSKSVFTKLI